MESACVFIDKPRPVLVLQTMKQVILALSFFLVNVIGKVFIESPTPELLRVRRKEHDHWYVIQVQTGSYLKFNHPSYVTPPMRHHPAGKVELRYYQQPDAYEEEDHESEQPRPEGYWMMAIMPSMGAMVSGISVKDWMEHTGFSDDTMQELQTWLNYRSLDDDYTVVLFSDDYEAPTLKQLTIGEGTFRVLSKPLSVPKVKEN